MNTPTRDEWRELTMHDIGVEGEIDGFNTPCFYIQIDNPWHQVVAFAHAVIALDKEINGD